MTIVDPLASMQAACISVSNGEASEIEMEWTEQVGEVEHRLTITVRREVKHYRIIAGTEASAGGDPS